MSSNSGGSGSRALKKKKLGEPLFCRGLRSRVGNECPWVNSRQMLRLVGTVG